MIDANVALGRDCYIHALANVYGCTLGDEVKVGAFVEIAAGVVIGSRCKISTHSYLCDGVTIEDDVFIGHGVMFTNDRHPAAVTPQGHLKKPGDFDLERTLVCRGAAIGSGTVILPGIEIGEEAMIGAGAVVTKNVPAGAIVVGWPERFLPPRRVS